MNISWIKTKGRTFDPIQLKIAAQKKFNDNAKQDYFGAAPNVFIGRFGYPHITVGILNTEEYARHDDPQHWVVANYSIPKIIDLRTQLINSTFKTSIKSFNDKLLELSQEVAMASKPVDVEISLEKKPQFRLTTHQDATPHGPVVALKKVEVTENPKIPAKVDKLVDDVDLKAQEALVYLHNEGFDEQYLTKLITLGILGVKPQRKLVPTRWGITAVDDTLGKQYITEIKEYDKAPYQTYWGSYFGNYYLILFFEDVWSYELFETIVIEQAPFATDCESYSGRKTYADNTAGGYYAARIGILEKLKEMKKQACVLTLRFIDPTEYIAPLGVWVVREAVRKTMAITPLEFGNRELMMMYAKQFVKKKFGVSLDPILRESVLLRQIKEQKKLSEFVKM